MRNQTRICKFITMFLMAIVLLGGVVGVLPQFLSSNAYARTSDSSSGFVVCQNTNYGSPCETFYYTSHDTCISLDQMQGHNRSVEYIGDYVGGYSAVMYHDASCGTYLARYDTNNPDIGWGLYDQFSSMRLEKHMPPNAAQISPANGAVLPAGTTELDLTYQNGIVFTVHVWDLTTHYDEWQGNINATTFHITGLQSGANYNWQVQGSDQNGTGQWSATWIFSVANSSSTPTPNPTNTPAPTSTPTSQPTEQPTQQPTQQANGSLNVCLDTNFGGCKNYKVGQYPDLSTDGYALDISSAQLGAGCTLFVFLGKNFTGDPAVVSGDYRDLSNLSRSPGLPNGFDNLIQSMKVESCTGNPPGVTNPTQPNQPTVQPTQSTSPTTQPDPAQPVGSGSGSHMPSGEWVTWKNSFVKGNTYAFVVRGYPTGPGDPAISYVNVTGYWNGAWHVLCHIPNNRPDLGDYYYCSTNFNVDGSYPQDGQITLSFDVHNVNGDVNYAPNSEYVGTFSSNPTKVLSLTYYPKPPAAFGESDEGKTDRVIGEYMECLGDVFFEKYAKIIGLDGRLFRLEDRVFEFGNKGKTVYALFRDVRSGEYVAVPLELASFVVPGTSCIQGIIDILTPVPAS